MQWLTRFQCLYDLKLGMSKMDPVLGLNRYRYRIYQTGYLFGTDSVPTFDIFGTGPVRYGFGTGPIRYQYLPVFTLKYRYRTSTEPYRVYSVPVPTFEDFRYRYFRFQYRSVPSPSLFEMT
ncbi:hypothetical protein Hanom_Chr12g01145071 [Helianthus anomalus]